MTAGVRAFVYLGFAACVLIAVPPACADETDNFTCRNRPLRDAVAALDEIMNARIQAAVGRANAQRSGCDWACLARLLRNGVGGSYRHPLTGIPHSNLERWIGRRRDVERCRLKFRESIYGARAYNQPWLFPFNGRIILLADSIRLSGRMVGLDKVNHFMREGLAHWKAVARPGGDIAAVMRKEIGRPGRQFRWNEYGLKGWSLTGVLAYSDLAASYSGFRFWTDLLSTDAPASFVRRDAETGTWSQRRQFTFADYVNDAWDEGVNFSEFQHTLAKQVGVALEKRGMTLPVRDCRSLGDLPHAELYVNRACLDGRPTPVSAPSRFRPPSSLERQNEVGSSFPAAFRAPKRGRE